MAIIGFVQEILFFFFKLKKKINELITEEQVLNLFITIRFIKFAKCYYVRLECAKNFQN